METKKLTTALVLSIITLLIMSCKEPKSDLPWSNSEFKIQAKNGVVKFETLDIADQKGSAGDGKCEHIITRVVGNGFDRVLIMDMCGASRPSRIFFDGDEANGKFPLPLQGIHKWRVDANNGPISIYLDDKEIWKRNGNYTVTGAIMGGGYGNRRATGQWRAY